MSLLDKFLSLGDKFANKEESIMLANIYQFTDGVVTHKIHNSRFHAGGSYEAPHALCLSAHTLSDIDELCPFPNFIHLATRYGHRSQR
jgi:hypothetical protein